MRLSVIMPGYNERDTISHYDPYLILFASYGIIVFVKRGKGIN